MVEELQIQIKLVACHVGGVVYILIAIDYGGDNGDICGHGRIAGHGSKIGDDEAAGVCDAAL